MKKRLSILLMAVFIVPIFALFGCDEVNYFKIESYTSSDSFGTVSGRGEYAENTSVTLYANAKSNSNVTGRFVCWLFQNSTIIENDSTYQIESTDTTSSITFNSSATTQGSYTAVFENAKQTTSTNMMYVKLDSYRFATKDSYEAAKDGILEDSDQLNTVTTTNLSFMHGQSSTALTTILSEQNQELKDNLVYIVDSNQALKLNAESSQYIYAKLYGKIGAEIVSKDLRSNISFKQSIEKSQSQNYSSQVVYNIAGTYEIIFEFDHNETSYVFILTYKNLTKAA